MDVSAVFVDHLLAAIHQILYGVVQRLGAQQIAVGLLGEDGVDLALVGRGEGLVAIYPVGVVHDFFQCFYVYLVGEVFNDCIHAFHAVGAFFIGNEHAFDFNTFGGPETQEIICFLRMLGCACDRENLSRCNIVMRVALFPYRHAGKGGDEVVGVDIVANIAEHEGAHRQHADLSGEELVAIVHVQCFYVSQRGGCFIHVFQIVAELQEIGKCRVVKGKGVVIVEIGASLFCRSNTFQVFIAPRVEVGAVNCVDTDGNDEVIERLPNQQMTGFTHISDDGRFLCIPTVDADAFNVTGDRAVEIDRRVQQHGLSSYLRVIDLQKGSFVSAERVPRGWVTHVQFRPGGYEILYNHEWCSDCGIRRMWYFDGAQHRPLRRETAERSRKDWTCHEMWQSDGRHVIYHGTYANGIAYIGRVDIRTGESKEIALPSDFQAYGHFTIRNSGLLVTDGYWREPSDELGKTQGRWISVLKVDWEKSAIEWHPLCLHNSSWNCQCSHPHPIFDESESFVYFTSDHSGKREVYRVAVPQGV